MPSASPSTRRSSPRPRGLVSEHVESCVTQRRPTTQFIRCQRFERTQTQERLRDTRKCWTSGPPVIEQGDTRPAPLGRLTFQELTALSVGRMWNPRGSEPANSRFLQSYLQVAPAVQPWASARDGVTSVHTECPAQVFVAFFSIVAKTGDKSIEE